MSHFWLFIKDAFPDYRSRRRFIYEEFIPLVDWLEGIPFEAEQSLFTALNSQDKWEHIEGEWDKALQRCTPDPSGAITSARSLLESVCKHILDDAEVEYKKGEQLPHLYAQVAELLWLSPKQHEDIRFKKILGNAHAVIDGLAALRNDQGDAHGKGQKAYRPSPRHARMAVGLAGTLASFLIETWQEQQKKAA